MESEEKAVLKELNALLEEYTDVQNRLDLDEYTTNVFIVHLLAHISDLKEKMGDKSELK